MDLDTSEWSGDGVFTQTLIDGISQLSGVVGLRIEDAPASRADAGYNFIANELYVTFGVEQSVIRVKLFGILPISRSVSRKLMTMNDFEEAIAAIDSIGPSDYSDEGMMQYLRTERITAPYQTKGYKLVELVRIYEIGNEPRP